MNKTITPIISSIVLLLAFFMHWLKIMGMGGSAYELIREAYKGRMYIGSDALLATLTLLIFPVSAVIILLYYMGKYKKGTSFSMLRFIKKLPIFYILIVLAYIAIKTEGEAFMYLFESFKYIKFEEFMEVVGIGLVLTIVASLILFFDNSMPQMVEDNKTPSTRIKEDTHSIFE